MQGAGSHSIKPTCPTFTNHGDGSLVSGHIEYADHRKQRIIYFSEKGGKFMLYSCTLDANDIFMASKAIQWVLTNLLTYDSTRVNFCKYVLKMLKDGKILMFLPTTIDVDPVLTRCLARCPLPVHVVQWSGCTTNFAADELHRIIERLPVFLPTPGVVEEMHSLSRPPAENFIRVSSQIFDTMKADFESCSLDRKNQWSFSIPTRIVGITVVHDGFEFLETISWTPIVSDASLDSLEYISMMGGENKKAKKVKMSEQLRRRRLNR